MKKIISMVLLCALIFNSISITVWSKEYDSVSEVIIYRKIRLSMMNRGNIIITHMALLIMMMQ